MSHHLNLDWLWTRKPMGVYLNSQWVPNGNYTLYLATVVIIIVTYQFWSKRRFYRLGDKIPGPQGLPLVGNAFEYMSLDPSKVLDHLLALLDKYNGLAKVWLGPALLVYVSKPQDLEIVMTSTKLSNKNFVYKLLDDILGQGLVNASGDLWRKHRRIITPTFHPSVLKHFISIFSEQSQTLVEVLKEQCDNKTFNVFPYIRNCALDFITETAFENRIKAQDESYSSATEAAERLMHLSNNRMFKLWLYPDIIFYRTKEGKEYLKCRNIVNNATEPLLESKKKEIIQEEAKKNESPETFVANKRNSFFRQLVNLNEKEENFNDKELRDEVMTFVISGYETTAATISFVLVMLGIHQDIQDQVYEEVITVKEAIRGRGIEMEDLKHFQLMGRVINETLRLYPVGPVIFRESTADVKLSTCTVPKGSSVAVVILRTHRDPDVWNEPDKFNPDNFLPNEVEKRHPYAYLPFSAGSRSCIGQKYAQISMRIMLFHLMMNYRIFCDTKLENIKLKSEVTMKMVGGFQIRLEPRTKL